MDRRIIAFIPNLFTLGNALLGCLGIIFVFNQQITPVQINALDETGKNVSIVFGFNSRIYLASFMIYGAALLDFFDGFVARALKASSSLGIQLDSLADAISFGVLPACIYYQLLAASFYQQPDALFVQQIVLIPAFLIALCAIFRLAKFNISEEQQTVFRGLPTPAMAIFTASLPLIVLTNPFNLQNMIINPVVIYLLVAFFSFLMVSSVRMFSLKIKKWQWKGNEQVIVFILISIILIFWLTYAGIAASILLYILLSVIDHFKIKNHPKNYS